jgi:cation diffusion facilitator family transporter
MTARNGEPQGEPGPDHRHDDSHEHVEAAGQAGHDHDHGGGHDHRHRGALGWIRELVVLHSHDTADKIDTALETSRQGMRALKISLAVLTATAIAQVVVVVLSGSVALLGDTLHNGADALTAVPLGLAFILGRRPTTRRYTYGYGRAEDLAGVAVVGVIALSSVAAGYESVMRLIHPHAVHALWAVAVAALVGFAGNEVVARYRISVGRQIGSAALVADGLHARADAMTSLAVLVGAAGVAAGFKAADPIIGLVITLAIAAVLKGAARDVYRRLMDAVDPAIVDRAEAILVGVEGVHSVGTLRMRWIGHSLRAEVELVVDAKLSVAAGHAIAEEAQHALLHGVPRLTSAIVHADPDMSSGPDPHSLTAHHHDD